jgi:hypothetical protein
MNHLKRTFPPTGKIAPQKNGKYFFLRRPKTASENWKLTSSWQSGRMIRFLPPEKLSFPLKLRTEPMKDDWLYFCRWLPGYSCR